MTKSSSSSCHHRRCCRSSRPQDSHRQKRILDPSYDKKPILEDPLRFMPKMFQGLIKISARCIYIVDFQSYERMCKWTWTSRVLLPRAEVNPGCHAGFPRRERDGEKEEHGLIWWILEAKCPWISSNWNATHTSLLKKKAHIKTIFTQTTWAVIRSIRS